MTSSPCRAANRKIGKRPRLQFPTVSAFFLSSLSVQGGRRKRRRIEWRGKGGDGVERGEEE
jgi:hypothetical protein